MATASALSWCVPAAPFPLHGAGPCVANISWCRGPTRAQVAFCGPRMALPAPDQSRPGAGDPPSSGTSDDSTRRGAGAGAAAADAPVVDVATVRRLNILRELTPAELAAVAAGGVDLSDAPRWPAALRHVIRVRRELAAVRAALDAKNDAAAWARVERDGFPPDEAVRMAAKVADARRMHALYDGWQADAAAAADSLPWGARRWLPARLRRAIIWVLAKKAMLEWARAEWRRRTVTGRWE